MRGGERQNLVSVLARLDQRIAELDEFLGLPTLLEVARIAVAMREELAELSAEIEACLLDHVEH